MDRWVRSWINGVVFWVTRVTDGWTDDGHLVGQVGGIEVGFVGVFMGEHTGGQRDE